MFRLSAPFGDALLEIETVSASVSAAEPSRVSPALPNGMRVDDCRLHAFSVSCDAGEIFKVTLRLDLRDGWKADFASGQWLDAFELYGPDRRVAAVATRDPEWFVGRFALEVIDASHPDLASTMTTATFRTLRATQLEIQAAVAWTNHPTTEREADSPWFAVDLAMTS